MTNIEMNTTQKIMIGGAQLGMNYGIANSQGKLPVTEIEKIFRLACDAGISQIDTAAAYGESETVLGSFSHYNFKIITKLNKLPENISDIAGSVRETFFTSLSRLKTDSCEGLLVHSANDLLGENGQKLFEVLSDLKEKGRVKKIGVSVYSPEQAEEITSRFALDIIQFPVNLLDQRFLQNNFLTKLKAKKIELHARSIFLQGLLLMEEENLPKHLKNAGSFLRGLKEDCQRNNATVRHALIDFVTSINEVDYYIFGVDSSNQFREIIFDFKNDEKEFQINYKNYVCNDLKIINPMNWS